MGAAALGYVATDNKPPSAKGLISQAATTGGVPTPKCLETPGKQWGGRFHYNAAILRPTVIERACITYPIAAAVRTRVQVTYLPVVP